MHEYGHTFQSRRWGPLYLPIIGLPSAISALTSSQVSGEPLGVTTHDFRWYEMGANRHAARYFRNHYNVDWNSQYHIWGKDYLYLGTRIETFYPRKRRR